MIDKMIITNSLGSNYSGEDIKLSLSLLLQPWKWKDGKETESLKQTLAVKFRPAEAGRNPDVILFYKGRQAIGEALKILKIGQGDEVIVQAFTCVAVVEPILESGAKPVYVDVAPRSLNPPLSSIKAAVTPKTKAIILQHTLGYVNPENDKIIKWCAKKNIAVIQDLAHSFGALTLKRPGLATVGPGLKTFYILSFSQDKVVDGVSGGGLVLTDGIATSSLGKLGTPRNDDRNAETWKLLLYPICTYLIRATYQYGAGKFTLGKIIHWSAKQLGLMNSPIEAGCQQAAMPNALAALALEQLKRLEEIAEHRRRITLLYNEVLDDELKIVSKEDIIKGVNLRYPIWVNNRDELEKKLQKHEFYLLDHWYDAPVAPGWVNPKDVKYQPGSCPNAEELAKHIFNLPTHVNISENQATFLANLINLYQNISKKARPFLKRPGLF